jgi:hypothetical protein
MEKIQFIDRHNCINVDPNELKNAPLKTNNALDPDANNGLITSIWGPHEWESFHATTFGYPIKPTDEEKQNYLQYFTLKGSVLPCIFCRRSYTQFINDKTSDTLLNMDVMESRETLTRWGLRLHNAVNKKLGVNYGDTYEELCYKYESYRAKCTKTDKGCLMPLDMKAESYKKADIRRAPIIDKKYSIIVANHAKTLGLHNYNNFLEYYSSLVRNTREWGLRDCAARRIIKYMRTHGISSLDSNGLPSIHELMLMSMLSSTLDNEKLEELYIRLK